MLAINKQLQTILLQSIVYLEEVLDSLHQERLAMAQDKQQTLLNLISQKIEKIDQLADLDQEMTTLLLECNPLASMTEYLAQPVPQNTVASKEKLRVLWEYYITLLRACGEKNGSNGNVVEVHSNKLRAEHHFLTSSSGGLHQSIHDINAQIYNTTEEEDEMEIIV